MYVFRLLTDVLVTLFIDLYVVIFCIVVGNLTFLFGCVLMR